VFGNGCDFLIYNKGDCNTRSFAEISSSYQNIMYKADDN